MTGPHLLLALREQRVTVGNINSSMGYVTVSITVIDGLVFHTLQREKNKLEKLKNFMILRKMPILTKFQKYVQTVQFEACIAFGACIRVRVELLKNC